MSPPDLHRFQTGSTIKNQKTKKTGMKMSIYETKWHQLRWNKVKCLFFNLFFYKTADIFNIFLKFHSFDPKMVLSICTLLQNLTFEFWEIVLNPLPPISDQDRISLYINQYNIKQTSDENKEKYQVGDYRFIQYQILQNYKIWTVRKTVRRITDEILQVTGLTDFEQEL